MTISTDQPDLDTRRAIVDELGAARDEIGRLGMPGASYVDRDAVLGLIRGRIDGRVFPRTAP